VDRYTGFLTKERNRETKAKSTWKERLESNFLYVIGGFVLSAVTSTYLVCSFFSNESLKLAQEHAANELKFTQQLDAIALEKAKKELQTKINDLNFRFSSIERHVGDKSFWDLTALMVTPIQMKNLEQNYVYHKDIHCYLSVPDSVSWKPMKIDGIARQMLFGNPKPSDETDPFFEFQKTRNIYLWRGPGLFKINTIDVETPVLDIFPFVSIEEFNNQDFSEMVMAETKNLKLRFADLNAQFTRIAQFLRDLVQKLKQNSDLTRQGGSGQLGWSGPPLRNSQSDLDIDFEKVLASIQETFESYLPPLNSDSSAFWASQFILQGFQLAKKVPKSSFQLLNVEKKENVFYLSIRTVFPPPMQQLRFIGIRNLFSLGMAKQRS